MKLTSAKEYQEKMPVASNRYAIKVADESFERSIELVEYFTRSIQENIDASMFVAKTLLHFSIKRENVSRRSSSELQFKELQTALQKFKDLGWHIFVNPRDQFFCADGEGGSNGGYFMVYMSFDASLIPIKDNWFNRKIKGWVKV